MKFTTLSVVLSIGFLLGGCSILPLKANIKENHFRFENFKRDNGPDIEYVHLMCFHKKETFWAEPKQYISGKHDLWVKASISKRGIANSSKEAFVNFDVNLAANKSYMINRKIENNKISMWLQEVDTGIKVSSIKVAELKRPLLVEKNLRRKQCESGTV